MKLITNNNYYITIIQAAKKSVDWGHFRHLSRLVGSQRSQLAMSRRVGRLQHPTNDSSHLSPWYRMCGKLHPFFLCYLTYSSTVQGWNDNVNDDDNNSNNNNNKSSLFTIHVNIILPSISRSSMRLLSVRCSNHKKNTCTHLKKIEVQPDQVYTSMWNNIPT